jgi:drug/metabolite transporter (DMT)-like permease
MAPIAEFAASGTAVFVALSNIVATPATRHFGPFAFNRWRLLAALAVLAVVATWRSGWTSLSSQHLVALAASSLVGIVVGDTAIYSAMARIGPRRTAALYVLYAPISALLSFLLLGERLPSSVIAGTMLVVCGVWLAIYDKHAASGDVWEEVRGSLGAGIGFGLLGAMGAAGAALMARPIMMAGTDASAAACVRIAVALVALHALRIVPGFRGLAPPTLPMLGVAALSGVLGMGAAMTLLLFALSLGTVGPVTTLASTTPVMLLPLVWIVSGRRPDWRAWVGATWAIAGVALIFLSRD